MTIIFCPANHENVYTGIDTNEKINCTYISNWAAEKLNSLGRRAVVLSSDLKALDMVNEIRKIQLEDETFVVCVHTNAGAGDTKGLEVMAWFEAYENYIPTAEYAAYNKSIAEKVYNELPNYVNNYYNGEYEYKQSPRKVYSFAGTEYTLTRSNGIYIELDYHDKEDSAKFLAGQEVAFGNGIADCLNELLFDDVSPDEVITVDFSLQINLRTGEVKLL